MWGTIIMVLTGLVLWFPTLFARFIPGILVPASQTIHYYEAWLATLAILVWQFFFVMFHPDKYPMSWTWLTGKMTKEQHGRWYEEEFGNPGSEQGEPGQGNRIGAGIGD